MKNGFLILLLGILCPLSLAAQCDQCTPVSGEVIDYCHRMRGFDQYCAQFTENARTFYFDDKTRKKNSQIKFPLPEDLKTPDITYLMGLAANKKLKMKAADLLFIENAIQCWRELEGIHNWDQAIVNSGLTVLPSGLAFKRLVSGDGRVPENGKRVTVHYTGYLENGKKFDSSLDRKQSFQFVLGKGQVIKGWDEGLALMRVGSRFLLRIPPQLGYGEREIQGVIPANSTLYFDVQLLSVE